MAYVSFRLPIHCKALHTAFTIREQQIDIICQSSFPARFTVHALYALDLCLLLVYLVSSVIEAISLSYYSYELKYVILHFQCRLFQVIPNQLSLIH